MSSMTILRERDSMRSYQTTSSRIDYRTSQITSTRTILIRTVIDKFDNFSLHSAHLDGVHTVTTGWLWWFYWL